MENLPEFLTALATFPAGQLPDNPLTEPCLERLRIVLSDVRERPSTVGRGDLAGLVGQVIWRSVATGQQLHIRVPSSSAWPSSAQWRDAGVRVASQSGSTFLLEPDAPWVPSWFPPPFGPSPALTDLFNETERRHRDDSPGLVADPCWPAVLGPSFARFTSPGQRDALRVAAFAPPGSTVLVCLPTGSGKSLVGWGPALLGLPARGVTLVVVPTVALGMDQERQVRYLLKANGLADPSAPLAWHGDLPEDDRRAIKQAIRDGRQVVVFASPEAATTALAPALYDAVRRGLLKGFVLDEAHAVAQWGNEFRPDFQAVAGLRKEFLRAAPATGLFKTRLLSATITQESFDTLEILFGPTLPLAAIHLRPEPAYWVAKAADQVQQQQWVKEAVRRLPRPLLLYVSRREDAEAWASRLREEEEILRVDFVHGGSNDREGVVERWRRNELDIVVATSAFGLGMDKADVRAVIHACVPETADRFYQEVGRAGRDGRASLSLVVFTDANLKEASSLNRERIISVKRGLERWNAMRATATEVLGRGGVSRIDLRARPSDVLSDSDANLAWNLRTLNLMARARLIEIESEPPPTLEPGPEEAAEAYDLRAREAFDTYFSQALVRPKPGHRDEAVWKHQIEDERRRTGRANRDQLDAVRDLVERAPEFGEAFADVYTLEIGGEEVRPELACGGCPGCRADGHDRTGYLPPEPILPAGLTFPVHPRLRSALRLSNGESLAVVTYSDTAVSDRARRRWRDLVLRELFPRLAGLGIREFAVGRTWRASPLYTNLFRYSPDAYVVHSSVGETNDGSTWQLPRLMLLDPADPPPIIPGWAFRLDRPLHVLLVPATARDPDRPTDAYTDRHRFIPVTAVLDELTR